MSFPLLIAAASGAVAPALPASFSDLRLRLTVAVVAVVLVVQAVSWIAWRLLGLRMPRIAFVLGILVPLVVVYPRLGGSHLIVPTAPLQTIPGSPVDHGVPYENLNDVVFQLVPWEAEVRRAFDEGHLPLWSDRLEGGSSPWVNPQAQVLSPIAWLARIFPLHQFLLGALAIKLGVAFGGAWAFARCLGGRRLAGFVAGTGFALGGGMAGWALFPLSSALALVPWLAAFAVRLVRRPSRGALVGASLAAFALATAGHPETAVLGGLMAGVVALSVARCASGLQRGLGRLATAALIGGLLASPLLLPFAIEARHSARLHELEASGMPRDPNSRHGFDASAWRLVLSPLSGSQFGRPYQEAFRGPFGWSDAYAGYAGIVALAGTGLALAGPLRRRVAVLVAFGAFFLLVAARFRPIEAVLSHVPILGSIAFSRFLPLVTLALAVAGGLGLASALRRRRAGIVALAVALAIAVLSGAQDPAPGVLAAWLLVLAAVATGWIRRARPAATALLTLAIAVNLVPFAWSFLPWGVREKFYPRTEFMESLRARVGNRIERVVGTEREVYPNVLSIYGLEDIRPHNPLARERNLRLLAACCGFRPSIAEYFSTLRTPEHPFVSYLGVRYAVSRAGSPPIPGWRQLEETDDFGAQVWENPEPRSRWFFPSRVVYLPEAEMPAAIAELEDSGTVFLDPRVSSSVPIPSARPPNGSIEQLRKEPGRTDLRIATTAPRLVATSIPGPEGWVVTSDSTAVSTFAVHGAFLAFVVPAGTSEVVLSYSPPGFRPALVLATAGLAILGFLSLSRFGQSTGVRG